MSAGDRLVLLGDDLSGPEPSLAGSAAAWAAGHKGGSLPAFDGPAHTTVAGLVRTLVNDGALSGVHDVSSGGLGVALAELTCRSGIGLQAEGIPSTSHLLAELPSRVVAVVEPDGLADLLASAAAAGVPATVIGSAGGDRFAVDGLLDLAVDEVITTWRDRLPSALGAGNVQG